MSDDSAEGWTLAPEQKLDLNAWTFWYDQTHWFPFTEGEDAEICGPGHQDLDAFAAAVRSYDALAQGIPVSETEPYDEGHIRHTMVELVVDRFGEQMVRQAEAGTIPMTVIWGVR